MFRLKGFDCQSFVVTTPLSTTPKPCSSCNTRQPWLDFHPNSVAQWRPFFLFLGQGSPLNSTNPTRDALFFPWPLALPLAPTKANASHAPCAFRARSLRASSSRPSWRSSSRPDGYRPRCRCRAGGGLAAARGKRSSAARSWSDAENWMRPARLFWSPSLLA